MIQFHLLEPSILLPFLKPLSLSLTSHYEEHDDKDNNEETDTKNDRNAGLHKVTNRLLTSIALGIVDTIVSFPHGCLEEGVWED